MFLLVIMATSMSNAQTPLLCQLCCLQPEIKWKCTECKLLMCDNCKTTVHYRIKTAKKHKIITITAASRDLHNSEVFSPVFNTCTTNLPGIHKLICCADDIIYYMRIINWRVYYFVKAKLLKGSLQVLQNMDIACTDFAISLIEEIVFTPLPGTRLIAMSTTTMNTETVLNMSPMLILTVHMSQHGELLLSPA